MPRINSFKTASMKSAWTSGIVILSLLALLSACEQGGGGGTTPVPTVDWTWVAGSKTVNQAGVYGTQGTGSSSNVPGAREHAVTWIDSSGKLWLFGGYAYDSTGYIGQLNDLWKYDPTAGEWTWVAGSSSFGQAGIYGTQGTGSPSNIPGARRGSVSWLDSNGKLWLFGGLGYAEAGVLGSLNDLWKYDPITLEWTWVAGSNAGDQIGSYGTQGTADPANIPGGRSGAVSWIDADGMLWLFGGYGYDSAGAKGWLNDLWQYDPATLEWTWVAGSNTKNQSGTYGTKGTADPANIPGGRYTAVRWLDSTGKLWLFGGVGYDSAGNKGWLNDLWKYDPTANSWTWISGRNSRGQAGIYGTQGTASSSNVPGGRHFAVSWIDAQGKLWLFGGYGLDSEGKGGWLNDLWQETP
jgi:N-acetylneuraminic acid mutarotase